MLCSSYVMYTFYEGVFNVVNTFTPYEGIFNVVNTPYEGVFNVVIHHMRVCLLYLLMRVVYLYTHVIKVIVDLSIFILLYCIYV